jgi:hypothetical protein
MDLNTVVAQFDIAGSELKHAFNFPVLSLQTKHPGFWQNYGKTKLAILIQNLPVILAFVKTDGQSIDPTILTQEEVESIIDHIRNHCLHQQKEYHET